jgi:hypothetical protein
MKNVDDNTLYRCYILLIVYSFIPVRGISYRRSLSIGKRRRAAMAEPLPMQKGSIILLSFILVNISTTLLQNKCETGSWSEHK